MASILMFDNRSMQVRDILRLLLLSRQISEWRLANETGVPQSTINAILSGRSKEQKDSTLQPLADYFGCTLAQLRGYEAIEGLLNGSSPENVHPVVDDEAVAAWVSEELPKSYFTHFVHSASRRGKRCFVYVAKDDALAPILPRGRQVFVDPEAIPPPTSEDQLRIALIEVNGHYALRSEVMDLGERLFKPLATGYRTIAGAECRLIGYVVGVPEEDWTRASTQDAPP